MDLALRGEVKTYFISAYFDVEFEFDADLELWIKSLEVIEAIVVDCLDDSWQFKIVSDKDNSLHTDILKDIAQAIEEKEGENLINQWLSDVASEYEFDKMYGGGFVQ
jgi:hypothetical protein